MELRGTPLISLARFKGPTRLGISNLFGLIPHPLRAEWHGPDITHFAGVCCDLARLYGGRNRRFVAQIDRTKRARRDRTNRPRRVRASHRY